LGLPQCNLINQAIPGGDRRGAGLRGDVNADAVTPRGRSPEAGAAAHADACGESNSILGPPLRAPAVARGRAIGHSAQPSAVTKAWRSLQHPALILKATDDGEGVTWIQHDVAVLIDAPTAEQYVRDLADGSSVP